MLPNKLFLGRGYPVPMLALPKVTLERLERNGTKKIIKKCFAKVRGAQMVPNFLKPRCKEI